MTLHAPPRRRLVVVGNGMVGMRTVEELIARAGERFDITVFGAEPHPLYNRILLSAVLAGEKRMEEIVIHRRSWYAEHGIALIAGDPVTAIDARAHTVASASGRQAAYDTLVLATGSQPLTPPIPGLDRAGVSTFRDIADVEAMIAAAGTGKRAVVIGGGLLGLEAAWGLKRRGMSVTVVHLMPSLMERQFDTAAGELLRRDLEQRGIAILTDAETEAILGGARAEGVRLADGRALPADLVVLAIGVRPNLELARRSGLAVGRGIRVGDDMRTSDPDIYAVGECVEHRGQIFGLVAPLWEQARTCAARLAGDSAAYAAPPAAAMLKITGIDMVSAGALAAAAGEEEITFHDAMRGIYKKLVLRDHRIVGTVLYGDVADGAWYVRLMSERRDTGALRDWLIFGEAYARQLPAKAALRAESALGQARLGQARCA